MILHPQLHFRVFVSGFFMPLDWSPPTLWTDASGFSVDASGLVPPIRFGQGGDGGDGPHLTKNAHTLINYHEIT